jgi:hypothetical protein
MTDYLPADAEARPNRSLAARLRRGQQRISDSVHAAGDAQAIARGWTITAATGRFGMGSRTYRDPRFDSLKPVPSRSPDENASATAIDAATRLPVRLASAIDEWAQAQNLPRLAGWAARPDDAPVVHANPEAGA